MKLSDAVAVCIIAQDGCGKVLILEAILKRRGYEFPGGGVESGEEPETAAARELLEETGLRPIGPMKLVYLARDNDGKVVACFQAHCQGNPISGREGRVFWGEPGILLRGTNTYVDYNRAALKAAGIKAP